MRVNVRPNGWSTVSLDRLLLGPPTYGINAAARSLDSRFPTFLRITDISDDGRFIHESKASVQHPAASNYLMADGDLVFARTGASVGKSYLYDPRDGALVYAGFLIRVRPNPEKLVPRYLKYIVQTPAYWSWVSMNSMRTGQPGINGQQYARMPVPLPPTKLEQAAIAEALSDADTLVESLKQLIAKKRQIKEGAAQELLTGRRRLPGFGAMEGSPHTRHTVLGALPEDWSVSTVGREFTIQLGKMLDAEKNVGTLKPYLGNRAVQWRGIELSDVGFMKMSRDDMLRYRLQNGDLLVCEGGEVGRCAIWRDQIDECYYQKALHRVRARGNYGVGFLKYVLEQHALRGFLEYYVTKTSIAHLPKDKFETVPIPVPPMHEERDNICGVLSDMEMELSTLEAKLTKARALKSAMAHNLLTGKIRLV